MLEPFQLPFVQHGIVEVLILAVAGGLIGTWIVLRGLAFYAHAVGTAAFPGLVLAGGLGFAAVLGAGATAALVAIAVGLLARREGARDRYDSLTALVLVAALAVGVILASDVFHSAGSVETLLFGSLLLVDGGDYAFAAVSAAIVVVGGLVLEQRWLATGFDPGSARALGARSALPDIALLALVALVAVAALSTLGALLATALLVVPAATTRLVCSRLRAVAAGHGRARGPRGRRGAVAVGAGQHAARAGHRRARRRACSRRWPPAGCSERAAPPWPRSAAAALALLAGCGTDLGAAAPGQAKVVATTTQIGDFARAVGGERAKVVQVLRPNTDPHDYEPRPHDVRETADADVVLLNGDELDRWMGDVVEAAGGRPGDRRPRRARSGQGRGGELGPRGVALRPALVARPAQRRGGDPRRVHQRITASPP